MPGNLAAASIQLSFLGVIADVLGVLAQQLLFASMLLPRDRTFIYLPNLSGKWYEGN